MQHFARIENGVVIDRLTIPDTGPESFKVPVLGDDGEPVFREERSVVLVNGQPATRQVITYVPGEDGEPQLDFDGNPIIASVGEEIVYDIVRVAEERDEVHEVPLTLAMVMHPDLAGAYVPCAADVEAGWTFDGTTFAAPVLGVAELAALRSIGAVLAARRAQSIAEPYTSKYAAAERETWRMQEGEARALTAGDIEAGEARFLMMLTGDDEAAVPALAAVIIAKADQFAAISAAIIRARKAAEAGIAEAKTRPEIDAIIDAAFGSI